MNALLTILAGGVVAGIVIILHRVIEVKSQEKALVILIVKEFCLLYNRCAMYFGQVSKGQSSYSTLFELSDSATFMKLSEVVSDKTFVDRALELRSRFFQIVRWADRANYYDEKKQKWVSDRELMMRALAFFTGEINTEKGIFGKLYKEYATTIHKMLDYLSHLNSYRNFFGNFSINPFRIPDQLDAIDKMIAKEKANIDESQFGVELSMLKLEKFMIESNIQNKPWKEILELIRNENEQEKDEWRKE